MIPEHIGQVLQGAYLVADRVNDTANNTATYQITPIDIAVLTGLAVTAFGAFAYNVWYMRKIAQRQKGIEQHRKEEEKRQAEIEESKRTDRIAEAVADKLEKRL